MEELGENIKEIGVDLEDADKNLLQNKDGDRINGERGFSYKSKRMARNRRI